MAQQGFLNKVREWIGSVAFAILLWSLEMTEDEFYDEQIRVAEQRDAPIHPQHSGTCLNCGNDTFIIRYGINQCEACGYPVPS